MPKLALLGVVRGRHKVPGEPAPGGILAGHVTLPLVLWHEVALAPVPAAREPALGCVHGAARLVGLDLEGLAAELATLEAAADVEMRVVLG